MASKKKPQKDPVRVAAGKKSWITRRAGNPARWRVAHLKQVAEVKEAIEDAAPDSTPELENHVDILIDEYKEHERQRKEAEEQLAAAKKRIHNLDTYGTDNPKKQWVNTYNFFREFIFLRDANEEKTDIAKAHKKWYRAKARMRAVLGDREFENMVERMGIQAGLPRYGAFSIQSFITS